MPIMFYINRDEKLMVSRYAGNIFDEVFVNSYKTLLSDTKYKLGIDELVDTTELTKGIHITKIGIKEVQELVAQKYFNSKHTFRTAVVAPEDSFFGVARMYELYNEEEAPEQVMVFRTMLEALKWLKKEPRLIQDVESWEKVTP